MIRCRSCGLYDGVHYPDCLAVRRAAQEKLQAECDHRSEYGVTQTTGDPPGPRCCGRCGLELPDLSSSPLLPPGFHGEIARARTRSAWMGWDNEEIAKELEPWPSSVDPEEEVC